MARAEPLDTALYREWIERGFAGEMRYLTDRRADIRMDPRRLLESAKSMICVGMLYGGDKPYSNQYDAEGAGWIARYAWGQDYHRVMRDGLSRLVARIQDESGPFDFKICVDTAPLLERSYARQAGLGWIGRNTCLIHEGKGSWFFLGEVLVSLELEPDSPPPDRCGTCMRCIEACPTQALVGAEDGRWTLDSRRCISYLTIELRGPIPEEHRAGIGRHVFGCDICQDVCPWNSQAPLDCDPAFEGTVNFAPKLEELAALTEDEFEKRFGATPVSRARYSGFLRNVRVAMENDRGRGEQPCVRLKH